MKNQYDYDKLLSAYFSGTLTLEEKKAVEQWKGESEENQDIFNNAEKVSKSLDLLQEMRRYNSANALSKINVRTNQVSGKSIGKILLYWQRIAAVLLLPLLILMGMYFLFDKANHDRIVWQTITTPPGIKSQAQLPDGTVVWLNSSSSLKYPSSFFSGERLVELKGEAFFKVAKDEKHPFIVEVGKIGIEVFGTEFNVVNYCNEELTEVVLASGKVKLFEIRGSDRKLITEMVPGQQAVFVKSDNHFSLTPVNTEKYISWTNGRLIFRDDPMTEVVRRLDHWFNVEIEIIDPDISQYIYTATFQNETIEQILDMLKKTSPIEYSIVQGKMLNDGSFDKQKIILKKRIQE